MDRSPQTTSPSEGLRKLKLEIGQVDSLEQLWRIFEKAKDLRRQYPDDLDVQVMVGSVHEEIIRRARLLTADLTPLEPRGAASASATSDLAKLIEATGDVSGENGAALIPPEVPRVDPKSWQIILGLAAFLSILVLVGFFYLIQTARKLNLTEEPASAAAPQTAAANQLKPETPKTAPAAPIRLTPTLRLYTDLVPGSVTVDDQTPRNLVDGELILDDLAVGEHSIKVAGLSGVATFKFVIAPGVAPRAVGRPAVTNALTVLVSQQEGRGTLVTNAGQATISLDGKLAGDVGPDGIELIALGAADHDLQVVHDGTRERFIMTYTPAPVLTAYVKSNPNSGILQVTTGQDDVQVFIEDALYRRTTVNGQLRLPLKAGKYPVKVHKDGFVDPAPVWVEVKRAEVAVARFQLLPVTVATTLQVKGAAAGTVIFVDHEFVAVIGGDGTARVSNIKPGEHTVELRHEQAVPKKFVRMFHPGETALLTGSDVALDKIPVELPAATPTPTTAPAPAQPTADSAAAAQTGQHTYKGGGFVTYGAPKSQGRYSFQAHGKVGGILKHGKLQWYAGYQDNRNYVLFVVDGKHAEIREVRDGESIPWNRVSFSSDSEDWVQVDLTVKSGSLGARVRTTNQGWKDMGEVLSPGRDFTQDKVGVFIPQNDEVSVANFQFANH